MIGLSTYAYLWRRHAEAPRRFSAIDILDDAVRLGVELVQLCDLPELESADGQWLASVRAAALERGIALETGTQGIEVTHLRAHLDKAEAVGASLVRSMMSSPRGMPTLDAAAEQLHAVMPEYEAAGVSLALETYEQISSRDLVGVIEEVGSSNLGICLDPGNSVARLEPPADVIRTTAPYVINVHIKDFAFTRSEAMVGFQYAGAELGVGLLDYDLMMETVTVKNPGRQINQIIEHWLTRQSTIEETCALERVWVDKSVAWLRARQ